VSYAEVARHLAPYFVEEPPGYFGGFSEHGNTAAWFRRFIDPSGWQ
jgi:hypothetical protein